MKQVDPTDELAPLAALHAACFDDPWNEASLKALLATPGTFAFALPDGFIMARVAAGEAEILTLAVAPAVRGRGLGRALVTTAAAHAAQMAATDMFLEVSQANAPALALYAGLGFAQVGLRPGYYRGHDARILKVALPLPPAADFA